MQRVNRVKYSANRMHVEKGIIMEKTFDSYGEYMPSDIAVVTYMFKYYEYK